MTVPALQISDLTKDFGGLRAVDQISFQVETGEFVGLIGPNGCGKTTTFNCISGLLDISSGKIEILGRNATGMRPDTETWIDKNISTHLVMARDDSD